MNEEQQRAQLAGQIDAGLKALKDQTGMTAAQVAGKIVVTEQAVSRWRHHGKISREHFRALADLLLREIEFDLHGGRANLSGNLSGKTTVESVPLLSWNQISLKGAKKLAYIGEKTDTVTVPAGHYSRRAFAVTVDGDSMVTSEGEHTFPPGCQILVEPEAVPKNGDFVVVELPDGDITFKELVIDGKRHYLKPLNPRYPILDGSNSQIIGVVKQAMLNVYRA